MPTLVDTSGIDRLKARFNRLANPNPIPVLFRVGDLMIEDNRRGVLAGRDGNDQVLAAVGYRPVRKNKSGKPVKLTVEQRLGQYSGTKKGKYSRIGSGEAHANNNLTSSEYRKLDGPPLAPRRQFSRVITNYLTSDPREIRPRVWEVVGAWINVLTRKGKPFLQYHFDGDGQIPRDLRGIRPWGREQIIITVRKWMISEIQKG